MHCAFTHHVVLTSKFKRDLMHTLTRPVGLEAVMRVRCTKGLSLHSFHGHFFVRSTDLLALPAISPDQGFAFQLAVGCAACYLQGFIYS
jgi:protein transport protein SEC24